MNTNLLEVVMPPSGYQVVLIVRVYSVIPLICSWTMARKGRRHSCARATPCRWHNIKLMPWGVWWHSLIVVPPFIYHLCAIVLVRYNDIQGHVHIWADCMQIHKRTQDLLDSVVFLWVRCWGVVCLLWHLRWCGAIVGRCPLIGGVLRSGWWGVLVFMEGLFDLSWHGYV